MNIIISDLILNIQAVKEVFLALFGWFLGTQGMHTWSNAFEMDEIDPWGILNCDMNTAFRYLIGTIQNHTREIEDV